MISFAFISRYTAPFTLYVFTTDDSTVTAYINSNTSIEPYQNNLHMGTNGVDHEYSFQIEKPATIQAILFKVQAKQSGYLVPVYRYYGYCMLNGVQYDVTQQMCSQMGGTWHSGYVIDHYDTVYEAPYFNSFTSYFDGETGIYVQQNNAETLLVHPLGTNEYVQVT